MNKTAYPMFYLFKIDLELFLNIFVKYLNRSLIW